MSEEEAIEILRDIPFFEQVENHDVNGPKWILKTNKRLAQARDMVLDLYKQEKEKNKELTEIKQQKLSKYLHENLWICKDLSENYIHKHKIREKIERYQKVLDDTNDGDLIHNLTKEIDVLKELLED